MADLQFVIKNSNITVTMGASAATGAGFKRDKFTTNGILTSFTLSYTPVANSLLLMYNGIPMEADVDYTISGKIITSSSTLDTGKLEAMYSYAVFGSMVFTREKFVTDAIEDQFNLSYVPLPDSLLLLYNGIPMESDVDYTISDKIITTAAVLDVGKLEAQYARIY